MGDLNDIGKLCDYPDCSCRTYLPYKCEFCSESFCDEHRSVTSHSCEGHSQQSVNVPSCPTCKKVLHEYIDQLVNNQRAAHNSSSANAQLRSKMFTLGHGVGLFGWGQADDPDFNRRPLKVTQVMADMALALHLTNGCADGSASGTAKKSSTKLKNRCS